MVYPRILDIVTYSMGFPGDSAGKESACNAETWVLSLGWEDPLGKGTATHSSILAWRISWTVWSMGSQKSQTQLRDFHFSSLHVIFDSDY